MKEQKLNTYKALLLKYGYAGKLLDIATGHGKYALLASDLGFNVTAFDARPDRIPEDNDHIRWKIANLKYFDYSGYSTINCLGILYHLPLHEQIILLKKINYTLVILDTHYVFKATRVQDGFSGKIYTEADKLESLTGRPMASFDELKAFWHTEPSLYTLFDKCNFNVIDKAYISDDRNFYVLSPK